MERGGKRSATPLWIKVSIIQPDVHPKWLIQSGVAQSLATALHTVEQGMKKRFDPTTLEIYRALYTSVAEEMGIALRRTAFSPNIKERRDYSCAVFDSGGRVIAQGDHMPVHLGSMPMAVDAALNEVNIAPGDVVAVNDPFAGGTHLPDVTLVMGVFGEKQVSGAGYRVPVKKNKEPTPDT